MRPKLFKRIKNSESSIIYPFNIIKLRTLLSLDTFRSSREIEGLDNLFKDLAGISFLIPFILLFSNILIESWRFAFFSERSGTGYH